jgi:hypothetical protein
MIKTKEEKYQDKLRKAKVCSICYRRYKEFGNNASPVNIGTCCDDCNSSVVIIARINCMKTNKLIYSISKK